MPSPRPVRRPHRSKPQALPSEKPAPKPTAKEVKEAQAAVDADLTGVDPRCFDINDDLYDPVLAVRARRAGLIPKTDILQRAQQDALSCHSLSDELRHDAR